MQTAKKQNSETKNIAKSLVAFQMCLRCTAALALRTAMAMSATRISHAFSEISCTALAIL